MCVSWKDCFNDDGVCPFGSPEYKELTQLDIAAFCLRASSQGL